MISEKEEEKTWADAKEELRKPSIRPVWRMPLSRRAEFLKKMSKEQITDPKAPISEKQVKLLYRILKLE